jgi:hypothetical protein
LFHLPHLLLVLAVALGRTTHAHDGGRARSGAWADLPALVVPVRAGRERCRATAPEQQGRASGGEAGRSSPVATCSPRRIEDGPRARPWMSPLSLRAPCTPVSKSEAGRAWPPIFPCPRRGLVAAMGGSGGGRACLRACPAKFASARRPASGICDRVAPVVYRRVWLRHPPRNGHGRCLASVR